MIYIRKGVYDCVLSIQNNVPEDEISSYGWILIDSSSNKDGEQYLKDKFGCGLYDDKLRPNIKYSGSLAKFTEEEKSSYFNRDPIEEEPIDLQKIKEELENKADKIVILDETGEEVVKEINLGFKMLEEEGNITKGQLIDKDTKGALYPETTWKRIIDKPNLYPVGSVYETTSSSDKPETLFGGKWSQISKENPAYIINGTIVKVSNGDSVVVHDAPQIKKLFFDKYGVVVFDATKIGISFTNGDARAVTQHFQGATWSGDLLYATYSGTVNGEVRINYTYNYVNEDITIYKWKRVS